LAAPIIREDEGMNRTLIRQATILSLDPAIGDLWQGDIMIEGSRIAAVAPRIAADGAAVIEADGMIALPGFVDTHRHTWQSLLRASAADWTLAQYFSGVRGVMGWRYGPDDMYLANLLGGLEALDAGITTLYDWSHNNNTPDHADEAVRGLKAAGLRAVFGYGNASDEWVPVSEKPTNFADIERVRRTHFSSDDQLVTMGFAPRGPQFTTLDLTEDEFRRSRDLGLRISVHVGDGLWGMNRPIVQLQQRGLLGDDITYVHCNTLSDEDIRLIGDSGGTASLSPEVELQMGHGDLATLRLLAVGVRPSLSIDIVTSIGGDMFGAMHALMTGTRAAVNSEALRSRKIVDPLPLTTRDALAFATIEGARTCGLADRTGSLTPGKEADLILIDTNSLNLFPLNSPYNAVVEAAHVGNVDSVFVAGVAKKRGGKLLGVDLRALRAKVDAARDALFARAGVPVDGNWLPRPFTAPSE
jgi:5-methylthioadenosine/S-adenosylhomocysteine deaminase